MKERFLVPVIERFLLTAFTATRQKAIRFTIVKSHCKHCHQSCIPTDAQLHVEKRKTLAAEELITLAGLLEPFKESANRVLYKMTGLKTSASTVRRVTEHVGEALATNG